MKDVNNKQRILKVQEIFEMETDEENKLSYDDLINRLKEEYGEDYKIGLKAIRDDIKVLLENNEIEVDEYSDKYGKKLFGKLDRTFEIYELRMLIDAIRSSRFITNKESEKLIRKIKSLTSKEQAKNLNNQIYIDNRISFEDKGLRYNIDKLHRSIQSRNIIEFKYGRYNVKKEFRLSNDGNKYEVEPYGLVWNNGFYYLVGYNIKNQKIINYRVDRMRNLEKTNCNFDRDYFNLAEHINNCFNMYPGDVRLIRIKFHNHLINAIIDRFGKDINISIEDEEHFILSTNAAINTGLIRWVLNWGSDAEVLYPESLVQSIKEEVEKMSSIYK